MSRASGSFVQPGEIMSTATEVEPLTSNRRTQTETGLSARHLRCLVAHGLPRYFRRGRVFYRLSEVTAAAERLQAVRQMSA